MVGRQFRLTAARLLCPSTHVVAPYEPTGTMKRAASKSMSPGEREGKPWVSNSEKHRIRYQAMLDAIDAQEAPNDSA